MSEVKLKVLRGTIIEKKPAKPGQIVSVSKKDADYLIRTQKAELFKEEAHGLVEKEEGTGDSVGEEITEDQTEGTEEESDDESEESEKPVKKAKSKKKK